MEKIEKNLALSIRAEPDKEYKVLIVLEPGTDTRQERFVECNVLMDNILSATLTGEQIAGMLKTDAVLAIETDGEMSVS